MTISCHGLAFFFALRRKLSRYSRHSGATWFARDLFRVPARFPSVSGMSPARCNAPPKVVALRGANAVSTALALAARNLIFCNRATIFPACQPMPIRAPLFSAPFAIACQGSAK